MLRRLFMSRKRRQTVAYLEQMVEADRARAVSRNLHLTMSNLPTSTGLSVGNASPVRSSSGVTEGGAGSNLPDGPCRQRPRPEPCPLGSLESPLRVLVIDEADVATSP